MTFSIDNTVLVLPEQWTLEQLLWLSNASSKDGWLPNAYYTGAWLSNAFSTEGWLSYAYSKDGYPMHSVKMAILCILHRCLAVQCIFNRWLSYTNSTGDWLSNAFSIFGSAMHVPQGGFLRVPQLSLSLASVILSSECLSCR